MKRRLLVPALSLVVAALCAFAVLKARRAAPDARPAPAADAPRIVSFAPAATECLFFVGLGPYVVGRSPFCDTPADVAALPVVGDLQSFDEKALAALAPTHAVVSSRTQPVLPLLQSLGTTVLTAKTDTDADVVDFLRLLGDTFPACTNGAFDAWLEDFRSVDGRAPEGVRAALILDSPEGPRQECMVAGRASYYDSLLAQVGIANVYADRGGFTPLAPEELLKARPDILFVVAYGRDPADVARDWGAWMGPDVRVAVLSESWAYRPGPRMGLLKKAFLDAASRLR